MAVPRFTVAMRGYDRAQVDAYCALVEAAPAGGAAVPEFTVVLRGYDPQEVDAWIRSRATTRPGGAAGPDVLRLAGRPAGERFPRVRMREGYDLGEVDTFVEHIRATLSTTLTAAEVQAVQFTTVRLRLGYDMQAVDEWLDAVQAASRG